jgi:hypothetical protein
MGGLTAAVAIAALLLVPVEVASGGLAEIRDVRSAAFFPILGAGLLLMLSCGLVARALRRGALEGRVVAGEAMPSSRVLGVAGALVAAGAIVVWLGFLPTAALLIAALSYVFGARRHWLVLALCVCVPLGIQLLFRDLLNVLLPSGILF